MAEATKKPKRASTKAAPKPQAPLKEGADRGFHEPVLATIEGAPQSKRTTIKESASSLAKQATDKARDYVAESKARAGGALDEVSKLMADAADTVDDKLGAQYGQYARSAANGIAGFSESLKGKEIEDMIADARDFVRKSPVVAIGIAAAMGFAVARVVKAGIDGAPSTGADSKAHDEHPAADA